MSTLLLLTLLYGAVWGAVWGLLDGLMQIKGILTNPGNPLTGIGRNLLAGLAGYFVALLAFGPMAYGLVGLLVAIPLSVVLENYIKNRHSRSGGR
ncbi:MAG TPA: hypothetical protein V6D08_03755 [Candidatus Obscuribacterales bacterium]